MIPRYNPNEVKQQSIQTKDEMLRVFNVWAGKHMPSNLANTTDNAVLLANHCHETYGFISIANLNASVQDLAGQLELAPTAPKKTAEEIDADWRAKDLKQRQQAEIDNRVSFDERAKKAEEAKKQAEAHDKIEATAQAQINHLLANFTINSTIPGKIDTTKTDECVKALSNIRINRGGKYSAQLTLKILQQAYYGESEGEIVRLAEKATLALIEASKPETDAERMSRERRPVLSSSHLHNYAR